MSVRRGILWDFDGTLAHRSGLWSDLLIEALDIEAGGHRFEAVAFRQALSTGFPWHRWRRPHPKLAAPDDWWTALGRHLRRALLAAGVEPRLATRAALRARTEYLRLERWQLFPDTISTLDRLTADGWRHVILSNHVPELPELVRSLGIADHFDAVLTSAITGYEKPHRQAFALGRAALGNPDELWMVGDSVHADFNGARALGLPAILVRQPIGDQSSRTDLTVALALADDRPPFEPRRASRVLLFDEDDRVLLVRVDPGNGRPFWATPGGGLEPGESFEQAASREVAEETGLLAFDLGPCVWTREDRGIFQGRRFHVSERIFVARVQAFEPSTDGYTDLERRVQSPARWWTAEELEASQEPFAPARLPALVRRLLDAGPPKRPINAGM